VREDLNLNMAEKTESDVDFVREQASETTLGAHAESPAEEAQLAEEKLPQNASTDENDENENADSPPQENTVTKTVTSQSQKMAKSKTFIVMGALCVCISNPRSVNQ
jgi:hypothetical protein